MSWENVSSVILNLFYVFLLVRMIMMKAPNMSGYSASAPGTFRAMYCLQNCPTGFPINSSKVALHARATLEAPEMKKKTFLKTNFFLHMTLN